MKKGSTDWKIYLSVENDKIQGCVDAIDLIDAQVNRKKKTFFQTMNL